MTRNGHVVWRQALKNTSQNEVSKQRHKCGSQAILRYQPSPPQLSYCKMLPHKVCEINWILYTN